MLEPNKEILIAKIIGLLNGLDGEGVSFKEENMLRSALTKYITFFDEKKREYLPNCLTCQSPCGRSNDYYINKQSDNLKKEQELLDFFNNYSDKMPLEEVIYQLIKISW